MFRLAVARLAWSSRTVICSRPLLPRSAVHAFRHQSSQSNDETSHARVPLASITQDGPSSRMGIQFRCKICNHTLQKTFNRQSYENGVVLIRCDSCENLHLIADHLGWFKDLTDNGKFKNVAQMLQAKGETIHRVTVAPTSDHPSKPNEDQPTETLLLNERTSTTV